VSAPQAPRGKPTRGLSIRCISTPESETYHLLSHLRLPAGARVIPKIVPKNGARQHKSLISNTILKLTTWVKAGYCVTIRKMKNSDSPEARGL